MPVEPARLADLDRVVELWVALAEEQREHGAHLTAGPNRAVMREALAQHIVDHTCLVVRPSPGDDASSQGAITGFVSFGLEQDGLDRDVTRGVVHNLYVVPGARDSGVGGELLDAAETALAVAGAQLVTLETIAENDAARRFYERRGYAPHRVAYERPIADGKDTKEEG
jgi:ribosomal protein S18 acetylase RimI-like enzyme